MTFHRNFAAVFRLILPCIVMGIAGYYLTWNASLFVEVIGWLTVGICVSGLLAMIVMSFQRGPRVIIDDRGIVDLQTPYGLNPWEEVRGVELTVMGGGHGQYLTIHVDHPETYAQRLPPHKRLAARANALFPGIGVVMINFSLLTPGPDTALACINGYLARRGEVRPGRCAACGYDLRATPDRCPECGTATVARSHTR